MAALCPRPAPVSRRSQSPAPTLSINTSSRGTPAAVPNKHLPSCSPGPRPQSRQLDSPIASPSSSKKPLETSTLLYPADSYLKISSKPLVYSLSSGQLRRALDHAASQPLPDPKQVFPWLHGLHPENNLQLAFFLARRRHLNKVPQCIRSITIVKARGDLTHAKLRGAIAPEEFLRGIKSGEDSFRFLEVDPRDGFSVRNFQIQAAKMATVSDIVVYGDDQTPREEVRRLAERIAKAQRAWREKDSQVGLEKPLFNTFLVQEPFSRIEKEHSDIVAIDSRGELTDNVVDFFSCEREEMLAMSQASEIANNVWLGPSPVVDTMLQMPDGSDSCQEPTKKYDLLIEASDMAQLPDRKAYSLLDNLLSGNKLSKTSVPQLEFPGSGSISPPTWSQSEVDGLMAACAWIYKQANDLANECEPISAIEPPRGRKDSKVAYTPPEKDNDGDSIMAASDNLGSTSPNSFPQSSTDGKKILLHCADGYTETSLLALAYYMYANGVSLDRAYIELHRDLGRNFFAYPTDVALLASIQPRILQSSPARIDCSFTTLSPPVPAWMHKIDGSLPSRITDYMYLGNLGHANNPGLLKELGIGQVLSVGESVSWTEEERKTFQTIPASGETVRDRLMFIDKVQDNGVDPLTDEISRCLEFIEKGRKLGTATLVHCRVGVSRSATICIAQVMNDLGLSFPRAYCYVRARRLNVIIQPHLRFTYELLKYEEFQAQKRGKPLKRDLEWGTIAREIAAMNRPYSRT